MTPDQYLWNLLLKQTVDTGPQSPVRSTLVTLRPLIEAWANQFLVSITPSGSFAKGTANLRGTDIDLFISLSPQTAETLQQIYDSLFNKLVASSYSPKRQNVSINITVGGYRVDLVPGKQQDVFSGDHSLYRRRANKWTKTNVNTHITHIIQSRRQNEIRTIKLWRDQRGLDFPSFYLELAVVDALGSAGALNQAGGSLATNVWRAFTYLRDSLGARRLQDPANTNNIVSDELSAAEKTLIAKAAAQALQAKTWEEIVT